MEIYDGWKSPRKFFVFRKTSIHDKIFISAHSPFLDEAKDTIFILVACPGETWQPKKCLWLTGFSKGPNTVRSYVTLFLVFLGFSLLFIPYNTCSGLLYYLLFIYLFVAITTPTAVIIVRTSQWTTNKRVLWQWDVVRCKILMTKRDAEIPVFLGSPKTANQVSLDGHWGRKNENH